MQELLKRVISEPALHARWLNTLSLLEYTGTRKIAEAISRFPSDETALRHLNEESRHALFFRKAANMICGDIRFTYEKQYILGGYAGLRYFQGLDVIVRRALLDVAEPYETAKRAELSYHYVTFLIEERAMQLYTEYDSLLQAADSPVHLQKVLLEEEGHLLSVRSCLDRLDPEFERRNERLREQEKGLYMRFRQSFEQYINNY